MKIIIIDDESKARNLLELLIEETGMNTEVVGKYETLEDGVKGIQEQQPDVVFLDIEMPEVSGLQLLEYIPEPNFELIFATAYDQYAIKAFELSALDYLLKPIDEEKLKIALEKVGQRVQVKERLLLYEQNRKQEDPLKICIPSSNSDFNIVFIQDILGVEANRSYCCIYTANKKYILSKSLSYFEDQYMPLVGFERCHRSWVVNLNQVDRFNLNTKMLFLKNSDLGIPVSRRNVNSIKARLHKK